MTTESDETDFNRDRPPWVGFVQFLLIAGLIVAFFLLGQSMVHHRFFRGGRIDRHGILRP